MARYTKTQIDDGETFNHVPLVWHVEIDTAETPDSGKIQAYSDWVEAGFLTAEEAARVISVRSEFPPILPRKG